MLNRDGKEELKNLKRYALNRRVMTDLKKRSTIGIAYYMVLSFIVVFEGGYFGRNTGLALAFLSGVNGICIFRFIHLFFYYKIENFNFYLNSCIFILTVLMTSLVWGLGFMGFMIQEGEYNSKLLMAICTAGLCSGGVVAFLPERKLAIMFNIGMLLPALTMMLVRAINFNLSTMVFLFSGYMIMVTLRGNKEYWDALENEYKLMERTVELKILSHTDALTGIYNRRFFNEIFEFEWKRALREKTVLVAAICDIDFFKRVNDTYGHIAGDEYLKRIADILKNTFKRDTDIVARYGGEEFVILLSGIQLNHVIQMVEAVRKKIESTYVVYKGSRISTTMSFGVSGCVPENIDVPSMLITRADHALYKAKNNGRNRVEAIEGLDGEKETRY